MAPTRPSSNAAGFPKGLVVRLKVPSELVKGSGEFRVGDI